MTKLEEVARAIQEALNKGTPGRDPDRIERVARAAMEELRDVSAFGRHFGIHFNCCTCGGHEEGWHNLIDAILEEKP